MKILKINNQYSCENKPSIIAKTGEWWYLNDKLHRAIRPAVVTPYSEQYYHRGIRINKKIAGGNLTPEEILKIENMEIRQVAMEIIGYEKFLSITEEIHRYSPECYDKIYPIKDNPMYKLVRIKNRIDEVVNEVVKLLVMVDPSKVPLIKYIIRVHPDETDCRLAVAHSYGFDTWEQYYNNKEWV
jgi:hypothetical protein